MQDTMSGARRQGRPRTAWMDNINTWTGLRVEESIGMTEDRDKWRKYVHGVTNPRIKDGSRTQQNSSTDKSRYVDLHPDETAVPYEYGSRNIYHLYHIPMRRPIHHSPSPSDMQSLCHTAETTGHNQ